MKRGLVLALAIVATSVMASGQIRGVPPSVTSFAPGRGPAPGVAASITSLGPNGFGDTFFDGAFFNGGFTGGFAFGHHPQFITGFRNHGFHHHFFPVIVPYYMPYYAFDYPYDGYDPNAYQQTQASQPMVVMVDPRSSDDRYGDHSFSEQQSSPPPQPQPQAQAPPAPAREQETTVLVFRDGHRQEVTNYAIVGQTLWDFGTKGTHKIPLSDLDLETTRKLNDDRGVDFVLPKT